MLGFHIADLARRPTRFRDPGHGLAQPVQVSNELLSGFVPTEQVSISKLCICESVQNYVIN